jgi:PKD repeat protein
MRTTTFVTLLGAAALAAVAGCVKSVEQPSLAGPSTFAHSIVMVADRDSLTQNGTDFTDIRITSLNPNGQSENVALRAQVFVDGVAQDFGTLSSKNPITPATIRYTAPPPSTLAAGQVSTRVTIGVMTASAGDARGESLRQIDIQLVPQGVILPSNPNLTANFIFNPAAPKVLDTVSFDASTTTNAGTACGAACSYAWDFGDGTTGAGQTTTHQFRAINSFSVTLTVTDARGAQAFATKLVPVAPGTPPGAAFTTSPSAPGINQDVFFDGTGSKPAAGRTITNYDWNFGDGSTGSGAVTSHKFTAPGSYTVSLITTDDAGSKSTPVTATLAVGPTVGPTPVANLVVATASPKVGTPTAFNASASTPGTASNITSYLFNWGDGTEDITSNPIQSHVYTTAGPFVVTLTVTDSVGRTAVTQKAITVVP